MELAITIFYPEINLSGTDQNLLLDSVYYDSPGLKPNSSGLSNGVIKYVDSNGFWKLNRSSRNAKKKILFLGDSVTMGIGVESDSTFAGRLNLDLKNIEVINSALIEYSHNDYKNIVKKLFEDNENQRGISSVVLFWCLNDIYSYHTVEGPGFKGSSYTNHFISFLRENSKFYHWLKNFISDRSKEYFYYDKKYYEINNEKLTKAVSDIYDINRILENYGVDFKLIILPYEYQLRDFNRDPQNAFLTKLSEYKVDAYDMMDDIQKKASNSKQLYLFGDGIHFSSLGHEVIANILLDKSILSGNLKTD
jgi:lysophospholipase L1-like esterase